MPKYLGTHDHNLGRTVYPFQSGLALNELEALYDKAPAKFCAKLGCELELSKGEDFSIEDFDAMHWIRPDFKI
jgi:hypothetical protein